MVDESTSERARKEISREAKDAVSGQRSVRMSSTRDEDGIYAGNASRGMCSTVNSRVTRYDGRRVVVVVDVTMVVVVLALFVVDVVVVCVRNRTNTSSATKGCAQMRLTRRCTNFSRNVYICKRIFYNFYGVFACYAGNAFMKGFQKIFLQFYYEENMRESVLYLSTYIFLIR